MPQSTCPSCNRKLWIGDSVKASVLTCPACLAKIENPRTETAISSAPLVHREIVAEPKHCPACGKRVAKEWRFCPSCGGRRGARGGLVDNEVQRDRAGTSVILVLLAVLGGMGLLCYLWTSIAALNEGLWGMLAAGVLAVLLLAGIATGIMFYRTRHDPSQRGVGRVVVGTLALIGVLCVLGLALFVFIFIACVTRFAVDHSG